MVTECPECGVAVRDGRTCGGCGWTLLRIAPSSVESPTSKLVRDFHEPGAEERARIAREASAVLTKLRERFAVPVSSPPLVLAESTVPTCAGCGHAADPAVLRDARLWHDRCWDRLRDRVARARWTR